jgi:hypothetical protein
MGIVFSLAGFLITLYLTILKFFGNESISNRPLFLVGILLIIVGFQSFSLGLIAEMITKSSHRDDDVFIETTI